MKHDSLVIFLSETISKQMALGDIVTQYPQAIEAIQSYGLSCVGCGVSYSETLEQSAKTHGFDDQKISELVDTINRQIKQNPLPTATAHGPLVVVSQKAAEKIKELMQKQGKPELGLRFGVLPGGCSGFSYALAFEEKPSQNDEIVESAGVRFFIDKNNLNALRGTTIDYVDALQGSGFKILNPNAKATCGCGQSFS